MNQAGSGLQGWSVGETYPWSVVIVDRHDDNGNLQERVFRAQNLITGVFADHPTHREAEVECFDRKRGSEAIAEIQAKSAA